MVELPARVEFLACGVAPNLWQKNISCLDNYIVVVTSFYKFNINYVYIS